MKKFFVAAILFILASALLSGQNPYFSQFDMAPLSVNPALTGDFEGRLRVNTNYRDQWSQLLGPNDYQTGQFSIDTKLKLGKSTELGIGVLGVFDAAGSLNLRTQEYSINGALHHHLGKNMGSYHTISIGINAGIGHRSLSQDLDAQVWGSEHDGNGGIDTTIIHDNPIIDYSFVYPLIAPGLSWSYQTATRFSASAGIAAYGLNRPNDSPIRTSMGRRGIFWSMFSKVELPVGSRGSIIPALYYIKQGSQDQLSFGSFGRYYFKTDSDRRYIQAGVFGKTVRQFPDVNIVFGQVAAAMIRVQWDSITVGFSSDIHNLGSYVSTYEFSFGYLLGSKKE